MASQSKVGQTHAASRSTRATGEGDGAASESSGLRGEWRSLRKLLASRGLAGIVRDVYDLFMDNNLLTYASAIAFQTLFAIITLSLTGLALLGFFQLTEAWSQDLAPQVAERPSAAAFTVIDNTVTRVLSVQRGFWLTIGAALAVWNVSSGVRGAMGALDDIYGVREYRSLLQRLAVSIALAVPLSIVFVGAVTAAQATPRIVRELASGGAAATGSRFAGWALAVVCLTVAVWLLVRYAPSTQQPASLVSLASILIVGFWLVASLAFGL